MEASSLSTPPSDTEATIFSKKQVLQVLQACKKTKRCFGDSAALKKMEIIEICNKNAIRCNITTFSEQRDVVTRTVVYKGGHIDGPENGPVADQWTLGCRPNEEFTNATREIRLQHSEVIIGCDKCSMEGCIKCHVCHGMGFFRCNTCGGKGQLYVQSYKTMQPSQPDGSINRPELPQGIEVTVCCECSGAGMTRCAKQCQLGKIRCSKCKGFKYFKEWKVLKVRWSCETKTMVYITQGEEMRWDLLEKSEPDCVILNQKFPADNSQPLKFDNCPKIDPAIIQVSQEHISGQLQRQNNATKVLAFHQQIDRIPLAKVVFKYKGNQGHFFIYGAENGVYFPQGYPNKGFFSCCAVV